MNPLSTNQPLPHPAGDPPYIGEKAYIRERVRQLAERMASFIYNDTQSVDSIEWAGPTDRISIDQAEKLDYQPVDVAQSFGPTFATFWFRVKYSIPKEWKGKRVDLAWESHSEACIWIDGKSLQGINPGRDTARIIDSAKGGESKTIYIEVACNRLLGGEGIPGLPFPALSKRSPYWFKTCELKTFNPQAWDLYHDLRVLAELEADSQPPQRSLAIGNEHDVKHRPALDNTWAGHLVYELNQVCNELEPEDPSTWQVAKDRLAKLYENKNGSFTHEITALGHAHIDTAWLWPIEETYRKTVRTFSSALRYMQEYPEFKFVVSQAYQYEQLEQNNPDLFSRMKEAVKREQWVPAGGTYIEPDCNLPSGESLCRQFLYGQKYFESRFGERCKEFWNPDVFGYNGQLPQIMKICGIEYFLTQKLSWNRFTTPPHHTFYWQGLDGSRVLTHFPPADTYNGTAEISELRYHAANYKDADRGVDGIYLYGYGDGGGGPTPQMLETFRRTSDLLGVPKVKMEPPSEFFPKLEDRTRSIPSISGELYFELHRGTYTSQAAMKQGMRDGERLLHDIEFFGVLAKTASSFEYPYEQVEEVWKKVLLNQFHDILPGSSIAEVHETARKDFDQVREQGGQIKEQLKESLGSDSNRPLNSTNYDRSETIVDPQGKLNTVVCSAYGFGEIVDSVESDPVSFEQQGDSLKLVNKHLEVEFSTDGTITSLVHRSTGRQAFCGNGNQLKLHKDLPTVWDAWDVEPSAIEVAKDCPPAVKWEVITESPLRVEILFEHQLTETSRLQQTVRLDRDSKRLEFDCQVDWHEKHKLLRVEFPTTVHTNNAAFETAFGTVERPTHMNTLADKARFETPGHRWADLSQPDFGFAVLTDYKHGFNSVGNTLGLSLLRSPTYPDEHCDEGRHHFKYAIMPHEGDWRQADVLREAVLMNYPITWTAKPESLAEGSLVSVSGSALVCDTVKPAEDGRGTILRLYDPYGVSGTANLVTQLPCNQAWFCNALEDDLEEIDIEETSSAQQIQLNHGPFEVITVRIV